MYYTVVQSSLLSTSILHLLSTVQHSSLYNDCGVFLDVFSAVNVVSPDLLTTPMRPSLTGMTRPISTSIASVPASIRSSLVTTASVLLPGEAQSFKSAIKGIFKLEKKIWLSKCFPYHRGRPPGPPWGPPRWPCLCWPPWQPGWCSWGWRCASGLDLLSEPRCP